MAMAADLPSEGSRLVPPTPVLPEELIVEILSWAPVKSLMRFRCVSKTWNSLVFHPTFVKLHRQRSSKNTHILLTCEEYLEGDESAAPCSVHSLLENPSSIIVDGCQPFDNYHFLGSSNGLVCLIKTSVGDGFVEFWVRFWNLATRIMSQDSPHLRLPSSSHRLGRFGENFVNWGFGYDDCNDTYKVVLVLFNIKSKNWDVKVYCLGDTCWRNILTCPAFPILPQLDAYIVNGHAEIILKQDNGQFVSGTLNWLALRKLGLRYRWKTVTVNELVIFSYDLNKETYRYLLMPDDFSEVPDDLDLGVLKGCLCLSHSHKRTRFVVWLMREFGVEKSWTQLLNVNYEHLQVHSFEPYRISVRPLCLSENDDVLLLSIFGGFKFVLYNLRDNRIDRTEDFKGKLPVFSYDYVQSLVLPYRN